MQGFPMPGSYPQSQYYGASDFDAESTSSMDVNVKKYPPPHSNPPRRSQPHETIDALGTKLQGSLHVSGSKRAEPGSDWSRPFPLHRLKGSEQRVQTGLGDPSIWGIKTTTPSNITGVPTSDFSFGCPAPAHPLAVPKNPIFGYEVGQIDQPKGFTTGPNLFQYEPRPCMFPPTLSLLNSPASGPSPLFSRVPDATAPVADPMPGEMPSEQVPAHATNPVTSDTTSRSSKLFGSKPIAIPRGHGRPSLFSPVPELEVPISLSEFDDPYDEPALGERAENQSSSKRQAELLQPPEEEHDHAPSPTKRLFGHYKAPEFVHTAEATYEEQKGGGHPDTVTAKPDVPNNLPEVDSNVDDTVTSLIHLAIDRLGLDEDDKSLHLSHLTSLYDRFSSCTDNVTANTRTVVQHEKKISDVKREIESLEKVRSSVELASNDSLAATKLRVFNKELERLNRERDKWVKGLANAQSFERRHGPEIMSELMVSLKALLDHYRTKYDAAAAYSHKDLDAKNELINKLRLATINLEEELKTAKSSLQIANETVERLQIQLQVDQTKAANDTKGLHASHRDRLDQVFAEHKIDKKDALNAQKEQYTIQIEDAESKFRKYKEASTQMESLRSTVARLEREKADVLLSKAAREKELEDIETQATQWRTFEDAYKQVKMELDQLSGDLNDAVAERDDLRQAVEAMRDMPSAHNAVAKSAEASLPMKGVGALKLYDQDLALLETYWLRQQRFAEMAKREMQAQVDEVDQDIADIERELAAFDAPEEEEMEEENTEPDADIADLGDNDAVAADESSVPQVANAPPQAPQLLDTLSSPAPWNIDGPTPTAVLVQGSSFQANVPQISRAPSQRPSRKPFSYADRAAGRIAPGAGYKQSAHSLTYNSSSYTLSNQRKLAVTDEKVVSGPLDPAAGAFCP